MWTTELTVGFVSLPPEKEEAYWEAIRYFAELMWKYMQEELDEKAEPNP